jgi:hypothetical protein
MTITDIERSFFKVLYDSFEASQGIKIFDSVYYVDFETFTKWIVVESLSHTTGPVPRANFNLHISTKKGLRNEKNELLRLIDAVCAVINQGARFNTYSDSTGTINGEMEVCFTALLPIMQHGGGGSFRTLSVGIVYAGEAVE